MATTAQLRGVGEAKPEGLKSQSEVYGLFLKLKEKPPGVLSQSGVIAIIGLQRGPFGATEAGL